MIRLSVKLNYLATLLLAEVMQNFMQAFQYLTSKYFAAIPSVLSSQI